MFSREQIVAWFDGSHLNKSPAQWDAAKLAWVNAQYMKQADDARLAGLVARQLVSRGLAVVADDAMTARCALFKDRCTTTVELADWIEMYFVDITPPADAVAEHVTAAVVPALRALRERLTEVAWEKPAIALAIKEVLAAHGLKMPQLAIPLRVLICGRAQTPSIDAVLQLFSREAVLRRLQNV